MEAYLTRSPDEWAAYRRRQKVQCETCQRMVGARHRRRGALVFCSKKCRHYWFPPKYDAEESRRKYQRQKAQLGGMVPRYDYAYEYPDYQPRLLQCLTCQRMYERRPSRSRMDCQFCSPACHTWMRGRQAGKYAWHGTKTWHKDACAACGVPIERYSSMQRYCSQKCKRAKSKRCGQLSPKVYDEVVARHGWLCHLCGDLINPALSRFDGMALTMDHLVPVSLGGSDDVANLRPAHRSCNSRRGNRPLAA